VTSSLPSSASALPQLAESKTRADWWGVTAERRIEEEGERSERARDDVRPGAVGGTSTK